MISVLPPKLPRRFVFIFISQLNLLWEVAMPSQSPVAIQHRMMRYNRTRELKEWVVLPFIWCSSLLLFIDSVPPSLHETARISGNIITIPRVPYTLYLVIQKVLPKCCLDYSYRLRKGKRRASWEGTLQYRMPSPTHELFKGFAAILLSQMWDGGSSKSYYPPAARKDAGSLKNWGSTGTCFCLHRH